MEKQIGNYSFIVGVILAVVLGLAAPKLGAATAWLWSLLVVLGLVVGFLNVSGKETKEFLLVTVSLVIVAYAGSAQINSWSNVQFIGPYLKGIFDSILAFVVSASVVCVVSPMFHVAFPCPHAGHS